MRPNLLLLPSDGARQQAAADEAGTALAQALTLELFEDGTPGILRALRISSCEIILTKS